MNGSNFCLLKIFKVKEDNFISVNSSSDIIDSYAVLLNTPPADEVLIHIFFFQRFNPFPDYKNLTLSKFKAIAAYKITVT